MSTPYTSHPLSLSLSLSPVDPEGVFKAKEERNETKGAAEVQDTVETAIDLPIDQVAAEEVEEEEDLGKFYFILCHFMQFACKMETGRNAPQGVGNVHTLCAGKPESDDQGNIIFVKRLDASLYRCIERYINLKYYYYYYYYYINHTPVET